MENETEKKSNIEQQLAYERFVHLTADLIRKYSSKFKDKDCKNKEKK